MHWVAPGGGRKESDDLYPGQWFCAPRTKQPAEKKKPTRNVTTTTHIGKKNEEKREKRKAKMSP